MRVFKVAILITAFTLQLVSGAQDQPSIANDISTSSERDVIQRFDPQLKKALVKALTKLEKNETISDLVDSSEELLDESVSNRDNLRNGNNFFGKSSTASSIKNGEDEVIIRFGNIAPVKSSDVGVQSLSISRSSGSAFSGNSIGSDRTQVLPRKAVKKETVTTSTTTTTPKPTHDEHGTNIEEVRKQDVRIAPAPLVAAFTVHQDASGAPKAIHPIFQTPSPLALTPVQADKQQQQQQQQQPQQQQQQQFGSPFPRNGQGLNPLEQEVLLQQEYIALQQREALLRQQFLKEQENLRRQQFYIQDQYRINQENIRIRLAQQQALAIFNQPFGFIPFQNFQQQQLPLPTLPTPVPTANPQQPNVPQPDPQTLQPVQPVQPAPVAPLSTPPATNPPISPLPTNQLLPLKEPQLFSKNQQQNSAQVPPPQQPFQQTNPPPTPQQQPLLPAHQFPLLAPTQQLPLKNAQPFFRGQLPALPVFNTNNAQSPAAPPQPQPQGPSPLQQLPSLQNHNRVFRHEQGVGNFGVNNNFPQYRQQQFNPYADTQLHNLLVKSGVTKQQDEDSYVIAKVLALNHGQGQNENNLLNQQHYRNIF